MSEVLFSSDQFSILNNTELERVQLYFSEKPSEEIRTELKSTGWHWSPRNQAWQRKNTDNALAAAKRIQMKWYPEITEQDLTGTMGASYNTNEETTHKTETDYDNNIQRESEGTADGAITAAAALHTVSQGSDEQRRGRASFGSGNILRAAGHASVSAGKNVSESDGRNSVGADGYSSLDGILSQGTLFDDRDGSGSLGFEHLPETEVGGERGESESGPLEPRNGAVEKSRKEIKDIRRQCRELLETKTDAELTQDDKKLLAQYEGAGGLSPGRLGDTESTAAGVLSEFYTPEKVIEKVWELADAYAPDAVTVLEPSAGTGRFAAGRDRNRFTLHELDETSSRIARILHPEAQVIKGAFQKQFFDESGRILKKNYTPPTYDAVVGNPPYGIYSGTWKGLGEGKHHNRYEEYFIERGLDSLNEKGILAFVVPSGFLRSGKDSIKELIASKGTLIDAWRLPNGTFPTTDVGADIIVMKRGPSNPDTLSADSFFTAHPDHILGEERERTGRFGPEKYVSIPDGMTLEYLLDRITPVKHHEAVRTSEQELHSPEMNILREALRKGLYEAAEPLPQIDFSRDNYNRLFTKGKIETPVETVKLGEHQFEKLDAKNRRELLAAVSFSTPHCYCRGAGESPLRRTGNSPSVCKILSYQ